MDVGRFEEIVSQLGDVQAIGQLTVAEGHLADLGLRVMHAADELGRDFDPYTFAISTAFHVAMAQGENPTEWLDYLEAHGWFDRVAAAMEAQRR